MDERDLDRAVDTAAASMMAREPRPSLSNSVMARVREDVAPAPRHALWTTAAAAVAVSMVVGVALMYQAPQGPPPLPAPRPMAVAQMPTIPEPPIMAMPDMRPAHRSSSKPITREVAALPLLLPEVSLIAPIETVPIEVALIEVPQLAREATSIEAIKIEPLTIEPLAASND